MKRIVELSLLAIVMVIAGIQQSQAETPLRTCVVVFESNQYPITKAIREYFSGDPTVQVFTEAVPTDILKCIHRRSFEILIVGHSLDFATTDQAHPLVEMGYITTTPRGEQPHLVFDHIFEVANQEIKNQRQTPGMQLKRIRLMACEESQLMRNYPNFQKMIQENGLQLDLAPADPVLSFLTGVDLVTVDKSWLAQSVRCHRLQHWQTDENASCTQDWWQGCDRSRAEYCLGK